MRPGQRDIWPFRTSVWVIMTQTWHKTQFLGFYPDLSSFTAWYVASRHLWPQSQKFKATIFVPGGVFGQYGMVVRCWYPPAICFQTPRKGVFSTKQSTFIIITFELFGEIFWDFFQRSSATPEMSVWTWYLVQICFLSYYHQGVRR